MRLRRKRQVSARSRPATRDLELCPRCGHVSPRGHGRLVDPLGRRAICVRCGADIGRKLWRH